MKIKKYLWILLFIFITIFFNYNSFSKSTYLPINNNNLNVHFIDVGQGDAILIQVNNKNIIIDSGSKENEDDFFLYLNSIKIKNIDYVIATHPHEDHIGNMSKLIKDFNIGNFYAPKVIHSSKSFEKMVEALISKDKRINVIKSGVSSINLGHNTCLTVLYPKDNINCDNLNNYSPVIKLQYGDTSFLFTGDAEANVEKELLSLQEDVSADVLKVGHHGSSTSSSKAFINKVNPSISVISVGIDNPYNHPTSETLSLLKEKNSAIFRTDINGTIIISSDGKSLSIITEKHPNK